MNNSGWVEGVLMVPAKASRVFRPRFVVYRFMSWPRLDHVDENPRRRCRAAAQHQGAARRRLLNPDRQLLHSAPLARGWNALMGAIRGQTRLDGALRELVIWRGGAEPRALRIAQHAPVALDEGLTQAQVDAVADWRGSALFDERTRDVLAYADAMTLQVQVPQPLFDALRAHFDDRELVELTATVAGYNMVSRFLEALQIEIETPP